MLKRRKRRGVFVRARYFMLRSREVNYMSYMNCEGRAVELQTPFTPEIAMPDALAAGAVTPSPLYKEVKTQLTRGLAAGERQGTHGTMTEFVRLNLALVQKGSGSR